MSYAQDFIVDHQNDTIFCKITEIDTGYIKYQVKSEDMRITNTLNRKYIQSYYVNESENVNISEDLSLKSDRRSSVRIAVAGGYAYLLGTAQNSGDKKLDRMADNLRDAYILEGELHYFFNERCGIGVNVNSTYASAQTNDVYISDFGNVESYKENRRITFVGPVFAARYDLPEWLFTGSVGLGALFYRSGMKFDYHSLIGTKTTLGMYMGLGGEYKFSNNFSGGLKLGYTLGSINSININGNSVDFYETMSVSNIFISAYLSFRTR